MQKLFTVVLLLIAAHSFSQPVLTGNSLQIKPEFSKGDKMVYNVTEKNSLVNLLHPVNAEHVFTITFTVLDTTAGEYTIRYDVKTISTTNKRYYIESAMANISNGLNIIFKINKDTWKIDTSEYFASYKRVKQTVDSIIFYGGFSKEDYKMLALLQKRLETPDGLLVYLSPLTFFTNIYCKPPFRTHKDFFPSSKFNNEYQSYMPGVIALELNGTDVEKNTAKVSIDFTGNRDSAVKYMNLIYKEAYEEIKWKSPKFLPEEMRNDIKTDYEVDMARGYPKKISVKHVEFYLQRFVTELQMELIE